MLFGGMYVCTVIEEEEEVCLRAYKRLFGERDSMIHIGVQCVLLEKNWLPCDSSCVLRIKNQTYIFSPIVTIFLHHISATGNESPH